MAKRHRQQWELLGREDPYWAVLSDHSKKGGRWPKDEFFASGEEEIERRMRELAELGIDVDVRSALDFGCGVGRLSRALASRFEQVTAIDISESMLEGARRVNANHHNISWLHNTADDLALLADESVSYLYCVLVLQHMPRETQKRFIGEFCRVLIPGGVLVFQTPSQINWRSWQGWAFAALGYRGLNLLRRVLYRPPSGIMEMHTTPRGEVEAILSAGNIRLAAEEPDWSAGRAMYSYTFTGVKAVPAF